MMPLLEMKNYSKFVVQYLVQLVKRHENVTISKDNFMFLFDFCHKKHNLPNEVTQQLISLSKILKTIISKRSDSKNTSIFEPLFVKLINSTTNATKNDIINILISLLSHDSNCFNIWIQLYSKNTQQSNILLKYIRKY